MEHRLQIPIYELDVLKKIKSLKTEGDSERIESVNQCIQSNGTLQQILLQELV